MGVSNIISHAIWTYLMVVVLNDPTVTEKKSTYAVQFNINLLQICCLMSTRKAFGSNRNCKWSVNIRIQIGTNCSRFIC